MTENLIAQLLDVCECKKPDIIVERDIAIKMVLFYSLKPYTVIFILNGKFSLDIAEIASIKNIIRLSG